MVRDGPREAGPALRAGTPPAGASAAAETRAARATASAAPRKPDRGSRPRMIFVIFPAYNEERVIRPTLLALADTMRGRENEYRAVLVDDGSRDRTVEEAGRAVAESGGSLPLTVLRHGE